MKRAIPAVAGLAALLVAAEARAFCGFYISGADTKLYNNATQVVLLRDGTRTVLSMQNNYQGPPSAFAMVVPVPVVLQKENVKTLPMNVFDKIDQLDSPRLVEYWEQDPCGVEMQREEKALSAPTTAMRSASGGGASGRLGVTVEAEFTVGEYEIVILSAKDSGGLDAWLKEQKYAIPDGAEPYLRPYVQAGSKFFVAKVDPAKVKFEGNMASLSPLRFHYDSQDFSLPVRLGLINAKDTQDLIIHVLAKGQRYEVSNYPNVTIPTNIDVGENVKGQFSTFYASLFDETAKKFPKSIITEYSWDASSCDPCPGPALGGNDIATFGGDVVAASSAGGGAPMRGGRGGMFWGGGGWTLTRLHARYDKNALGADIVFQAAPPIVGGREHVVSEGKLERGAQSSSINNFQGRYAIRHPWTGPIACANPRRGIWGGPPLGVAQEQPKAARNLAFAPRGGAQLASFVKGEIPELQFKPGETAPAPVASDKTEPIKIDATAPPKGGCAGCSSAGGDAAPLGALALLGLLLRRRRR